MENANRKLVRSVEKDKRIGKRNKIKHKSKVENKREEDRKDRGEKRQSRIKKYRETQTGMGVKIIQLLEQKSTTPQIRKASCRPQSMLSGQRRYKKQSDVDDGNKGNEAHNQGHTPQAQLYKNRG